jgi:uncharacterized protein (TIGR03067 family)
MKEETPMSRPPEGPPRAAESRLQQGSIRLFRVGGIDVLLHWSWFLFALLRLQPTGTDDPLQPVRYDVQAWYLLEYVALFGLVLLHEFGHVLACRSVGGIANCIVLWPLGGIALVDPPARPGAVLWSIVAGPLVNVVLVVPTVGLWLACGAAGYEDTLPDVYRLATALAWMNGWLLLFNILPIYPLDGGQSLYALLWFVLGRARALMTATAVSLLTTVGILAVAVVQRSLTWGIIAVFGVLFSLVGLLGARALIGMLRGPRRQEVNCPNCAAAPPVGNFWACPRCWTAFDVFASAGKCPTCSTPTTTVLCPGCGRFRPYPQWLAGSTSAATLDTPLGTVIPQPTVAQRIGCGAIFALFALVLCGLPKVEEQPLGLIVWTLGGAILGMMSAGTITRTVRSNQAQRRLRGTWRLVEVDGQEVPDSAGPARQLILKYPYYEERVGGARDVRGMCWLDSLAEPAAISLTSKMGPDAGQPRQGIYRVDGDALLVCLAYPGVARPTAFVAQPGVQEVRRYRRR